MNDLSLVATGLETMSQENLLKLNHWFAFVWEMIQHHHTGEDNIVFPFISKRVSLEGLDILTADHHELDAMVETIGENFKRLETMTGGAGYFSLWQNQSKLISSFSGKLTDHLECEEAVVFPLINQHFEHKEQMALEQQVCKTTPMKHLSKLIPWIGSALSEEELKIVFKGMPLPLRLMYNLRWKKQYENFAAVAKAS